MVCLLTDYGSDDEFAGVLRRIVAGLAPGATIVDVTHGIAPFDIRAGALALWRAAPYLAPAVLLAVVDPGVATSRRAVAVAAGPAHVSDPIAVLVGPDNGLLLPATHALGGIRDAVELTAEAFHLQTRSESGATFAGRDVFAPVAGHLAAGVDRHDLGRSIDPASLIGGPLQLAVPAGDRIDAEVLWVDRFGNAQLNVTAAGVAGLGPRIEMRCPAAPVAIVTVVEAFADLPAGAVGLVPDSAGLLGVCLDRQAAASLLGLRAGDGVSLRQA